MAEHSGLRLVALKCQKCGSLLNADTKDVVFYCGNCDSGFELINEKDELVPVSIDFAIPNKKMTAEIIYYPFWVFEANVKISGRDAAGSITGFIMNIFGKEDKQVGKFYVPAFETPLENIRKLGLEFTKAQPEFDVLKKGKLKGCSYSSKDAMKFADFIFLSMEAGKSDTLRSISYDPGLSSPKVIAIPFYKMSGSGLMDGIMGISI
jgi:ribosomal protein S27AE